MSTIRLVAIYISGGGRKKKGVKEPLLTLGPWSTLPKKTHPVLAHSCNMLVGHYPFIMSVFVVKTIPEQRQTYFQLEGLLINEHKE